MTRLNNNDHRRILLIDQNRTKQNLRANILRNYEIEVHTANSITEAATLWTRYCYDLVLLAAHETSEEATAVSAQIRRINPRQRIGLLVGPPIFVRELGGMRRATAPEEGCLYSEDFAKPLRGGFQRACFRAACFLAAVAGDDPEIGDRLVRRPVAFLGWSKLSGRIAGA